MLVIRLQRISRAQRVKLQRSDNELMIATLTGDRGRKRRWSQREEEEDGDGLDEHEVERLSNGAGQLLSQLLLQMT